MSVKVLSVYRVNSTVNTKQEQTQQVLDAMFQRFVIPGEHVIDQGEAGDNFYIIERLVKK